MASSHKDLAGGAFDALVTAEAQTLAATTRPDVQAALHQFREKRDPRPARIISIKKYWPAIAAASILVIAVITLIGTHRPAADPAPTWITITATAPGRTDTLPDGSLVKLFPQSSLSYPATFSSDRQARLSGDAIFIVAHNAANPFRVRTKDVTITVLGTSFSITTDSGQTQVAVTEGLIEVARNQQHIRLSRREKLLIPRDTTSWQKFPDTTATADTVITPAKSATPAASSKPTPPPPPTSPKFTPATPTTPATPPNRRDIRKPSSPAQPAKSITSDDEINFRLDQMRSILSDLVSEHCIADQESITSATLTPEALIVNDVAQPNPLFEKFRAKYLDNSGNGYYFGSVHITGRGYFFNKSDLASPPHQPRPPKTRTSLAN